MRKRNAKIQEFIGSGTSKPICAKFGPKTHGIVASGDDKNAISLWKLNRERPLMTLSSQGATANVISEISAISFNMNETEVVSGTNRGSISVWDINSQKLITTLKGHSVAINTIAHFPSPTQEHLLLTGSYDSSVKLWDLRQKQTVSSFRGHDMQVNCLEITPDGKWFASGAQDSLVKLWDIGSGKSIYTFNLHEAPVTCLKFNPYELTLATGSADKTVKYWDLEKFGLICSTKPEATGIQSLSFDPDGKFLFTAAQDAMRVWHVDTNELNLLDNVETSWRGVQELAVQVSSKNEEESLLGIAITNVSFGLWACPLKTVNKDPLISPEKFLQMRKAAEAKMKPMTPNPQKMDQPFLEEKPQKKPSSQDLGNRPDSRSNHTPSPSQRDIASGGGGVKPQNVFVAQAQNNLIGGNNYSPQNYGAPNGVNPYQPFNNNPGPVPGGYQYQQQQQQPNPVGGDPRYNNYNPVQQSGDFANMMGGEQNNDYVVKKSVSQEKMPTENKPVLNSRNGQIQVHDAGLMAKLHDHPAARETNLGETTIIDINKANPDQLNLSTFIKGIGTENNDKNLQYDAISDIAKDHSKFRAFMKQRLDHLELVLHYWNSGNIRSALNAINGLNLNDSTLIMDLLNMSTAVNKTGQMNVEAACIFLQKAVMLVDSKFDHHVKMGFKFINKTFKQYYDEIVSLKTANVMNMVDLAREERVKKYDKLIDEFDAIARKERIRKLAAKHKDEVGEMAGRLINDLELFLNKIKAGDSNRR